MARQVVCKFFSVTTNDVCVSGTSGFDLTTPLGASHVSSGRSVLLGSELSVEVRPRTEGGLTHVKGHVYEDILNAGGLRVE